MYANADPASVKCAAALDHLRENIPIYTSYDRKLVYIIMVARRIETRSRTKK